MILPSPLTRIKVTREYLEMVKRAYTEAGGIYKLSKAEQKQDYLNTIFLRTKSAHVFCL